MSHILLVDDSEAQRYVTKRTLVAAGFDVVEAIDGTQAVEKSGAIPGVILLDVALPDFDGFEVCRRVKSDTRTAHIPVVFLSATYQTRDFKDTALRLGAVTYLFHPVEPGTLLTIVRSAFASRHGANRKPAP